MDTEDALKKNNVSLEVGLGRPGRAGLGLLGCMCSGSLVGNLAALPVHQAKDCGETVLVCC